MVVADEYCKQRGDGYNGDYDSIGHREAYKEQFATATSGQFWALFRAEALRPSFSGGFTVAIFYLSIAFMAAHYHYPKNYLLYKYFIQVRSGIAVNVL